MVTISNDALSVKVSEKGAELQSLVYNGVEYIWQANAAYWGKHSPVLFPIIGELKDGKYVFEGKEYKMPRHGFARNCVFDVIETSASSVSFRLASDEDSFALYPFRFIFMVTYRLEATQLFCTYLVENTDTKVMYFSVGGHPAFNVPLQSNLNYADYALRFNNDAILKKYLLRNGLTYDSTETIMLNERELPLRQSLFYSDAIVLKHIGSNQVTLVTPKDAHGLTFSFDGFEYFGIWAAKDAPFVCLEPWCGIADNVNHNYELVNKEGINELGAGESWRRTWSIEVF